MRVTRETLIIEPERFCSEFQKIVGGDVAAAASRFAVSGRMIRMLMTGERKPSAAILAKCGLKIVFLKETNGRAIS
jgi:hypothetical protein